MLRTIPADRHTAKQGGIASIGQQPNVFDELARQHADIYASPTQS